MSPEETNTAEATETQLEEKPSGAAVAETPDESAPPEEGKTEPTETAGEVDEEGKPKKVGGFKRRVEKLNARIAAEREARLAAEEEVTRLRGQQKPAEAAPTKKKPTAQDFILPDGETYDHAAYTEALADWVAEQKFTKLQAEADAKRQEAEAKSKTQDAARSFMTKEAGFADEVDDYEKVTDVVLNAKGTGILQEPSQASRAIADAIFASDFGPAILYYLGQNPDEAERINTLSPTQAVMALGHIEAQLAEQEEENPDKTETTPPPVSRAPKPISPLKKPSSANKLRPDDPNDAEKMSTEEWRKAMDERERQRIRAQRGR